MSRAGAGATVVGGAALGWAGLCAVTYARAFGRRRWGDDGGRGWTPVDIAADHRRLEVRTGDGVDLLAWHLPGRVAATVVISGGHRGRAGDVLGIGGALHRAGFGVVTFGWRGTPGSGAAAHTLGAHERLDLEAVIDAVARDAGAVPVGLLGYSLGAAVSIIVAAADPRVLAVCADSGFASATEVIEDGVARSLRIPGRVVSRPVAAALRLRTGARLDAVRPLEEVGRIAPRPLLLIHGEADRRVDVGHARRLHAAAGAPKELWIVEDAIHVGAYFSERRRYAERVTRFFEGALCEPHGAAPIATAF